MEANPIIITLAFTLLWFVLYWIVAGVIFAIIGLVRFMRINTARFSCLFTLMSFATAYAAAWTGYVAAARTNARCLAEVNAPYEAIPGLFRCATTIMVSNAILWFIVLLAIGIALMFISRLPDRPRQTPKV
jgi:predicted permease